MTEMNNDIEIIKKFIEKNIEIINSEEELKEYNPQVKTESSIEYNHSKKLKELQAKKYTEKQLLEKLEIGYKLGQYSPYEIQYIWENYFKEDI